MHCQLITTVNDSIVKSYVLGLFRYEKISRKLALELLNDCFVHKNTNLNNPNIYLFHQVRMDKYYLNVTCVSLVKIPLMTFPY